MPHYLTALFVIPFLITLPACQAAVPDVDDPPARFGPAGEVIEPRIQTETETVRLVRLVGNLAHPWGVAFLPEGRMVVTERGGRMLLVDGETVREITGVPEVVARGQGGLLDVVAHPDVASNGWIYFTYAAPGEGGAGTALARARLDGTTLTDLEVLYTMPRKTERVHHFGSRIAFPGDGTVLFTIGDRGEMQRAQDLMDPAGSTIRLTEDGGIPPDNPFVGRDDALPELFTVGNRNSQGMAIDPATGRIWQTEHGPRGGDELNLIRPGRNYGWPIVSEGADYRTREPIGVPHRARPEFEAPVAVWTPSIAVSGTAFYDGNAFPSWRGNLLVGGLALQQVRRVVLDGERVVHQETLLEGRIGRIRDVRVGPDGLVYLLTDLARGGLYRLEPVD